MTYLELHGMNGKVKLSYKYNGLHIEKLIKLRNDYNKLDMKFE